MFFQVLGLQAQIAPPKKTRVVRCSTCQQTGHYAKTCPTKGTGAKALGKKKAAAQVRGLPALIDHDDDSDSDGDNSVDENDGDEMIDKQVDGDDGYLTEDYESDEDDGKLDWVQVQMAASVEHEEGDDVLADPNMPKFTGRKPGLSRHCSRDLNPKTELDFFFLFWAVDSVLSVFVAATNSYASAHQKTGKSKQPVTVAEFKAFLALVLFFGLIKFPSRGDAFRGDFAHPFVTKLMTAGRFAFIFRNWHWMDYTAFGTPAEVSAKKKKDPMWAVKSLVKLLATSFKAMYNPHQQLDVDEQCVLFKGRHRYRQYNPNKPNKWHLKMFALNDAITGYQFDNYFYEGNASGIAPGHTATTMPVKTLVHDNTDLHFKNFILATDNWYTSVELATMNSLCGIYTVGTIKSNRSNLPAEIKKPKKGAKVVAPKPKAKGRGDFTVWEAKDKNDKEIFFTHWMDKKDVRILHTFNSSVGSCQRMVKSSDGADGGAKEWGKKHFAQPLIIRHYNKAMGGTDFIDQNISYYFPLIKSAAWANRIFVHMLMVSVVNAHILFNFACRTSPTKKKSSLSEFIQELIIQLAKEHLDNINPACTFSPAASAASTPGSMASTPGKRSLEPAPQHLPMQLAASTPGPRKYARQKCKVCGTKGTICCNECLSGNFHVYLCNENPAGCNSGHNTCWAIYHRAPHLFKKGRK